MQRGTSDICFKVLVYYLSDFCTQYNKGFMELQRQLVDILRLTVFIPKSRNGAVHTLSFFCMGSSHFNNVLELVGHRDSWEVTTLGVGGRKEAIFGA